jgi:hypothetical protein
VECLRTPYVVPWHPWRGRQCVRAGACARPHGRQCFIPGNFITDTTVRPSHGRPCGHRSTVHPFVRYHLHDNPAHRASCQLHVQARVSKFKFLLMRALDSAPTMMQVQKNKIKRTQTSHTHRASCNCSFKPECQNSSSR